MSSSTWENSPPNPETERVIGVCSALSPYTLLPSGRIGGAGTVHMSARAPRGTTPQCRSSVSPGKSVSTRTRADAPGASDSTSTRMPTRVRTSTSVNTVCFCSWNENHATSSRSAGEACVVEEAPEAEPTLGVGAVSTDALIFLGLSPKRPMRGFHLPLFSGGGDGSGRFPAARACKSAATRRFCAFFSGLSWSGSR